MGMGTFLFAQPFFGGERKESGWDLSKRKAAEGHSPITCHPSVHPLLPALPFFSGPLQCLGLGGSGRKQLRRGPAKLFDRGAQEVGTRERVEFRELWIS